MPDYMTAQQCQLGGSKLFEETTFICLCRCMACYENELRGTVYTTRKIEWESVACMHTYEDICFVPQICTREILDIYAESRNPNITFLLASFM